MANLITDIKAVADCRQIFRRFWPSHYRERGNSRCMVHEDSNESMQVSKGLAFCHGCEFKADAIDLYQLGTGVTKGVAIREMARELGLNGGKPSSEKAKDLESRWQKYKATALSADAVNYLEKTRALTGISEQLRKAGLIGFSPGNAQFPQAIVFPLKDWSHQALLGVQYIPIDGGGKKFSKGAPAKRAFFKMDGQHGSDFTVVSEGIVNSLSVLVACKSIDADVVAILGSEFTQKLAKIPGTLNPVLFFDNDAAGKKASVMAVKIMNGKCRVVDWKLSPAGMNDANDLLKAGHADIIERMVRLSRVPTGEELREQDPDPQANGDNRPLINLVGGELHAVTTRLLDSIRTNGVVFERSGELVRYCANDGRAYPVTIPWLQKHLTELVRFEKPDARSSKRHKSVDCPFDVARTITAMQGEWKLPTLNGVIASPTITSSGRLIEKPGYDPETGLYLHFGFESPWTPISTRPSESEVKLAIIDHLWPPFEKFPFESRVDRGACLAAILTAVTRPTLQTAPGFNITSPVAASGKSLLASCLGILAGEDPPRVVSIGQVEEEIAKLLLSELRNYSRCISFDNLTRPIESESLCAFLTTSHYSGRILGSNQIVGGRPSALVILNGNNCHAVGDLSRRLIHIRIDPKCEKPFTRTFDLDPSAYVKEHRFQMIRAALTILSASLQSGHQHNGGRLASFEEWSDFIRNAVIWVGKKGWLDVTDPVESIMGNYAMDSETQHLGSLLECWWMTFGVQGGTVGAALKSAEKDEILRDCLLEVAAKNDRLNARILGNWIAKQEGRIIEGRYFERCGQSNRAQVWRVNLCNELMSQNEFVSTPKGKMSGERECKRNHNYSREASENSSKLINSFDPTPQPELLI